MTSRIRWTEETEVIVVGYGGAGAVAAITAHDAGAKVLIMEKQLADTETVTNHTPGTRMSAGGFMCPDDAEKAKQYLCGLRRIANEPVDPEYEQMLLFLAERMMDNVTWMQTIGGELGGMESLSSIMRSETALKTLGTAVGAPEVDYSALPGSDSIYVYFVKATGGYRHGSAFFKALSDAVNKRGIPVMWGTPGQHLVIEDGAVRGVIGQRNGRPVAIRATRGVVLTCGGFEFNDWLKANYLRPSPIHFYGNPGNAGEGINMALEAGAALWHMNCISCRAIMKFPEHPIAFGTQRHEEKGIIVDKRGNRFTNERFKPHAFGYELAGYDGYAMCYPRVPCYWVFDDKRMKLGPLASQHGACNPPKGIKGAIHYTWSQDNMAEVDREWIWKAGTIEDIGRRIAQDPDNSGLLNGYNFKTTVQRYNQLCRSGADTDFNRPQWTLAPLEDPPYYAVKLWPGGPNTQGGPRRNMNCQILHPDRTPIPRLYGCGELGSFWGMLYNGGGNLGENIALGRLVGENVASEKLWR